MNWNYEIDFEWLYGIIIFLTIVIINRKKLRNLLFLDMIIHLFFYVYVLFVVAIVFFPIPLHLVYNTQLFPLSYFYNIIPFKTVLITLERNPIQPLGNFLLLLPFGMFYTLFNQKVNLKLVILLGLLISLGIELIQLTMSLLIGVPFRVFDIDDLILNTSGAIVGSLIIKIIYPWLVSFKLNSNLINNN